MSNNWSTNWGSYCDVWSFWWWEDGEEKEASFDCCVSQSHIPVDVRITGLLAFLELREWQTLYSRRVCRKTEVCCLWYGEGCLNDHGVGFYFFIYNGVHKFLMATWTLYSINTWTKMSRFQFCPPNNKSRALLEFLSYYDGHSPTNTIYLIFMSRMETFTIFMVWKTNRGFKRFFFMICL